MKNTRQIFYFIKLLCLIALTMVACAPRPDVDVSVLSEYEALFQREEGWTGADGVYSVALSDETILWLFGDTFIGKIKDGRHENADLINNSIGIQHGKQPSAARVEFHYGSTPQGKPAAFILPVEPQGWLWIYDGILTDQGLFLFMVQIDRTAENSVFGFKVIGNWLGRVTNPQDPPSNWKIRQHHIPWSKFAADGDTIFGSALLRIEDYLYIYGTREVLDRGIRRKNMILARVALSEISDFSQWRFYTGSRWVSDHSQAGLLCEDIANEYSVSYHPALQKYISVYSQNSMSENIVARIAPDPDGPWSDPIILYQCPEEAWHDSIFCYAAKAHPEITLAPDQLIVTYVTNSYDFNRIETDARLYRPRFLLIRFKPSALGP